MYEQQEPTTFKAYVFGDPKAYNLKEIDYFICGILQDLDDMKQVKFGNSLGDI